MTPEDFNARLQQMEDRITAALREAIFDSETRLLRAFHEWAAPVEQRQRSRRSART